VYGVYGVHEVYACMHVSRGVRHVWVSTGVCISSIGVCIMSIHLRQCCLYCTHTLLLYSFTFANASSPSPLFLQTQGRYYDSASLVQQHCKVHCDVARCDVTHSTRHGFMTIIYYGNNLIMTTITQHLKT
jgi:hypothetical protein